MMNEESVAKKMKELEIYRHLKLERKNGSVFVFNKFFNTATEFKLPSFLTLDKKEIEKITHHGKNVEHITRVTGYFSKINSWNKGKIAELKDRQRVTITEKGGD